MNKLQEYQRYIRVGFVICESGADVDTALLYDVIHSLSLATKNRFSVRDIQAKVKDHPNTIRKRVKFLENFGIIKRESRNYWSVNYSFFSKPL